MSEIAAVGWAFGLWAMVGVFVYVAVPSSWLNQLDRMPREIAAIFWPFWAVIGLPAVIIVTVAHNVVELRKTLVSWGWVKP